MLYFATLILTLLQITRVLCDNGTESYLKTDKIQSRQHRLLSFNTSPYGDVNMELAFNVPFISIPVKKSLNMAQGAIANVNIGAIALGGAVAIGVGIIMPAIVLFMSKKMISTPANHQGYRSDTEESRGWWHYLSLMDQVLTENDIDTTSCMQRMVCWSVKTSSENVGRGEGSSSDKILDGLTTIDWIKNLMKGTAIDSAINHGRDNVNCSKEYSQCKINQERIEMLAKNLFKSINTQK